MFTRQGFRAVRTRSLLFQVWAALGRASVHLHGKEAAVQQGRGKHKDLGKKAVLLSGPPGIGKTTAAMIITR